MKFHSCLRLAALPLALSAVIPALAQSQLAPVVVTAARVEQPLTDVVADVTLIDREQIERSGATGLADVLARVPGIEFARNGERYSFLRWGQTAFDDFKVVPPGTGIVHQVNIEYLARVVMERNGVRTLRLTGGLGPLQEMGVTGILTFTVEPLANGAKLIMNYSVSGDASLALDQVATPVDGVLMEQIGRLSRLSLAGTAK